MSEALAKVVLPPVGTRYAFAYGSTTRVYRYVARLTRREAIARGEHGCDRNLLQLVEETGVLPEHAAGVGSEICVEDEWFNTRAKNRVKA